MLRYPVAAENSEKGSVDPVLLGGRIAYSRHKVSTALVGSVLLFSPQRRRSASRFGSCGVLPRRKF